MCGGFNSILGVTADLAIERMKTGLPTFFKTDVNDIRLCGAVFDIDEKTGKCRNAEQILFV
jgi:calcineurin-like phosphoesterase